MINSSIVCGGYNQELMNTMITRGLMLCIINSMVSSAIWD